MKKNVWRDFQVIAKRAGVKSYAKPIHSLRKSRITDWAGKHPPHVVMAWAGHSDLRTTLKYYSKVQESDFEKATGSYCKVPESDFERATGLSATSVPDAAIQEQAIRPDNEEAEAAAVIFQFAS